MSRSYISKLELGRKPPTADVAGHLDRALATGGELVELAAAGATAARRR